jgi:hypothetical protein
MRQHPLPQNHVQSRRIHKVANEAVVDPEVDDIFHHDVGAHVRRDGKSWATTPDANPVPTRHADSRRVCAHPLPVRDCYHYRLP